MRLIAHVDVDAFFAAVEEIENPTLRGKPVIVGAPPDKRGVVASANYLARSFGVAAAMTTARALRRCPKAILCPLRPALYQTYATELMTILSQQTDLIEPVAIDEAFLDLSALVTTTKSSQKTNPQKIKTEKIEAIARHLQKQVQQDLGLSLSIGLATSKIVAKIASNAKKPGGLVYISPGTEAAFLAPLPIRDLWGIGPKMARELADMGVKTIGQLAALTEQKLVQKFGIQGAKLWRHAQGIDHRRVKPDRPAKSMSQETTFPHDISNPLILEEALKTMSQTLALKLQEKDTSAGRITLKFRYEDFSTLTRSVTRTPVTCDSAEIYRQAHHLWQTHWNQSRPIRLIGVRVSQLVRGVKQRSLFD